MREILFRGKRTDTGKWIYGQLARYNLRFDVANMVDEHETLVPVLTKTIGQFTGLTDKNDKKIFDGDILHIAKIADGLGGYYQPPLYYPVNVVVKWDLCAWTWETLCEDKRYISFPDAWCHYECEVIGNIHDNSELL